MPAARISLLPRPVRAALLVSALVVTACVSASPIASAASSVVAQDAFSRFSSAGWGSADMGGSWSTPGAGVAARVEAGQGLLAPLAPGRDSRTGLASVSVQDVDVQAGFIVTAARPIYQSVEGRRQPDGAAYRGRVITSASGSISVDAVRVDASGAQSTLGQVALPTTLSAGKTVNLELGVTGSSPVAVTVRAWLSDAPAPAWQLAASDSSANQIVGAGSVGVHHYLSRAATTPTTIAMDSFSAASTGTTAVAPVTVPTVAGPTSARGSAPMGSTRYAAPADALYVSPTGADSSAGTIGSPKRSLAAAVSAAGSGRTIVLRGGTYHESVSVPAAKSLTVQSYPGEAVWLDGSRSIAGFTRSGSAWVAPWGVKLDSSPTYTWGKADSTTPNWQFVNPAYSMAAHPDQIWVGGSELRQVSSLAQITSGTFFADYASSRVFIGSDPTGKGVEGSDLTQALAVYSSGSTIRGLGVRRYANSVPHQGVVVARANTFTMENVVVQDSATAGVGVYGSGGRLRNVSVLGSGQVAVQGQHADNLVIENTVLRGSNDQHFNQTPAAGGVKVTGSRGVSLSNSEISGGIGNGFWSDMASYDITVVNSTISDNTGRGVFLELSSKAVVAGNLITNNADEQIAIRQTDRVQVWNNTIIGTAKAIEMSKDSRNQANSAFNKDPRRPFPDPEMPWTIGNSVISNNVVQATQYLLEVQDFTHTVGATEVNIRANGNVYSQPTPGTPSWIVVWARAGANPYVHTGLGTFASTNGQERNGLGVVGTSAVTGAYALTPAVAAKESSVAQVLPSDVAAKLGRAAGTRHLGYWG